MKVKFPLSFLPHANMCLSTVRFSDNDISKVILMVRMLKLSDKAICKPLHMIFTLCLETGVFPIHWKKANPKRCTHT